MIEPETRSLEDLEILFSLNSSWDFNTFESEFNISIEEASNFSLFCIADHQIHIYSDATTEEIQEFLAYINAKNIISESIENHEKKFSSEEEMMQYFLKKLKKIKKDLEWDAFRNLE